MERQLFAIKLSGREKEAMDYTASQMGKTLSKLYYEPLKVSIHETLGLVLLYKVDRRRHTDLRELDIDTLREIPTHGLGENTPPIILDFYNLINENLKEFEAIFESVDFDHDLEPMHELDVRQVARELGAEYIDQGGNLKKVEFQLATQIFFQQMISLYYRNTAVGSLKNLNTEWYLKRMSINRFKDGLIRSYEKMAEKQPAEAMEVTVVG